jgi:tripartite ATP-independent transporter DctM subunit
MLISLTLLLLLFIALGMPIAFSMGLAAFGALALDGSVPLLVMPQKIYSSLDSFPLLAIPLFILAGAVMNVSGITTRLIDLSRTLVGRLRGGMGHVTILTSFLFATISGSASASAAAVGSMMVPAMVKDGFRKEDAAVVNAAAAILGPVMPPSVVLVIYASMTGLSVGTLFLAGIVPGILIALVLMGAVFVLARRDGIDSRVYSTPREMLSAFRRSIVALLMPAIIVGGIVSGIFTATEAGVIAVAYGAGFALLTKRSTVGQLMSNVTQAAITSSSIMIIMGGASVFGWIIAREGVPVMIVNAMQAMTTDPTMGMMMVLGILLVIGVFIEPIPALIMLVPVLQPLGMSYGFDPYQFAMVITLGVLMGSLTPPVAVLLLITCKIAGVDQNKANKPLIPVFGTLVGALILVAFIPQLSTLVPQLFSN